MSSKHQVSSLIRLSKAKTAYGLIQDVKRAIIEEPRRVNMGTYTCKVDANSSGAPACGTIGCFAGWVSILAGQGLVQDDIPARRLLGDDLDYSLVGRGESINGANTVFNGGSGDGICKYEPGTDVYVQKVIERIDRFVSRNLKALRARRLPSLRTRRRYAEGRL